MTITELLEIEKLAYQPLGDTFLDGLLDLESTAIYYRFIYHLVKRFKPALMVELGVCTGRCTAHMAAANPDGVVLGIDHAPMPDVEEVTGRFSNIFLKRDFSTSSKVLSDIKNGSVDLCFIDTEHKYEQVLMETGLWLPKMRPGGVVLWDDIDLDAGMREAWAFMTHTSNSMDLTSLPGLHHSGFGVGLVRKEQRACLY